MTQAVGRRRIHASISYDTPLNNAHTKIYDILKTLPFKNVVKSNEYKLFLNTLSDFDCLTLIPAIGVQVYILCEIVVNNNHNPA